MQNLQFLPNDTFLPDLRIARNRTKVNSANKPNTQVKEYSLYMYMKPFHFCRMVNFHFPIVEIPFPDISSPKFQSVDIFCFSILMYSSVDEKRRPQIRDCFWARRRNKITHKNCDFISTKCFINVSWLSESTDCAAENSKSRVMLRDQRGDQPSNNWENLNFSSDSARILAFSCQRHT